MVIYYLDCGDRFRVWLENWPKDTFQEIDAVKMGRLMWWVDDESAHLLPVSLVNAKTKVEEPQDGNG